MTPPPIRVLVVTDKTAATPQLLEAIRDRAKRDLIHARVLVPNPAPAEWHPGHPERHAMADEARLVLERALGPIEEAAGSTGACRSVMTRWTRSKRRSTRTPSTS
jgi:hypothetical protein